MNADQPRKRAVTFASAIFHAGVSRLARLNSAHQSELATLLEKLI
jgi:hypothetical protein